MSKIATATSNQKDAALAGKEAVSRALAGLEGETAALIIAFASETYNRDAVCDSIKTVAPDVSIIFIALKFTETGRCDEGLTVIAIGSLCKGIKTAPDAEIFFRNRKIASAIQEANEQLQESEARLRALICSMPDVVCIKDGEGRWIEANDFDLRLFQIEGVDYKGKKDSELAQFSPFYREAFLGCEATDEKAWKVGTLIREDEVIPRPDAPPMVFDVIKQPLFNEDGSRKSLIVVWRDITERKKAEKALKEAEERYRTLFDNAHAVMLLVSPEDGSILDANKRACKFYGWTKEELCSMKIAQINQLSKEQIKAAMLSARSHKRNEFLFKHKLADGSIKDVEVFSSAMLINGKETLFSLIFDRTERQRLEEQLNQARKMEAIGQLAGGIAHDFNNILQVISGFVELSLMGLPQSAELRPIRSNLEKIQFASDKAAKLVSQILAFSRKQIIKPEPLSLNDIISDILKMLGRIIGEHIRIKFVPGYNLGSILADRVAMEQVLMNLCTNARDAMPDGGELTIETENVLIDEGYSQEHMFVKKGRYVLLSITDTGCGMTKDIIERIFEPFFTTKDFGKGTGLGLATVFGIVKQHDGMINVYSEPAKGSTFKVYLPRHEMVASEVGDKLSAPIQGGSETILIAEDDEAVRELLEVLLTIAGYNVISASNGEEALLLFKKHSGDIDLFLSDIVMPGMNGVKTYEQMKPLKPGLPALFASGYNEHSVHVDFVLKEGFDFISKPYDKDELLRSVRNILDRKK